MVIHFSFDDSPTEGDTAVASSAAECIAASEYHVPVTDNVIIAEDVSCQSKHIGPLYRRDGGDAHIALLQALEEQQQRPQEDGTGGRQQKGDAATLVDAVQQDTDLIPAVYEGGLRTWECTFDLLHYLDDHKSTCLGQKVIELGCGSGLPGIAATRLGASRCDFQDYNEGVLALTTIPNVLLNALTDVTPDEEGQIALTSGTLAKEKHRFFAGDWGTLHMHIAEASYDLLLMSETIYNPVSYPVLENLLYHLLRPDGMAIVAAKTYYFGVGGSTDAFVQHFEAKQRFQITERTVCEKQGVAREVIVLKKKKRGETNT